MDNLDLFLKLGLATMIGAAVGVERHWREREEREGSRAAGIRTFTMFGMLGGVAGLIERSLAGNSVPIGLVLAAFLVVTASVMTVFELREAIAEKNFSATSVIAAVLTFAFGALGALGETQLASAGAAALVTILAAREFLHRAIRTLTWVELRSAVILLAMVFVLLPVVPGEAIGPFGGVSPRTILLLAITLAGISFIGYIAVRLLGASRGDLVAGAIGGIVSSTATTLAFARRARIDPASASLASGAVAAGAVSLARTGLLVVALAPSLSWRLVSPLSMAGLAMIGYALAMAARSPAPNVTAAAPANPFEFAQVARLTLLLVVVAFLARAATDGLGASGLMLATGLAGLADVDAATVTVAGMLGTLSASTAAGAIGVAIATNMVAKAIYGSILGSRPFAGHLWAATVLAAIAAASTVAVQSLLAAGG